MRGLLKDTPNSELFSVFGQPEIELKESKDGWLCTLKGVDIYNPLDNTVRSSGADKVAELDALVATAPPTPAATAFLRHAVRADILEGLDRPAEARQAWEAALASAPTAADRAFVQARVRRVREDVPDTDPRASS